MLAENGSERLFRDRSNPFDHFSEVEFRQRYRLSKDCTFNLINNLRDNIKRNTSRSKSVSPELQVLVFLKFLASGQFYNSIGDLHGINSATVCRIIRHVSTSIAALHNEHIQMPTTREDIAETKRQFYEIDNFPGVIGTIDCTHIRLVFNVQRENAANYVNRHHWYSLNVQVVSDAKCRIINIVARWPGSVHDSRIWNNSRLCADFEMGRYNGYLLGDGGYPCLPTLLTPLLNPQGPANMRYNRAHIKTRSTVE